MEVTNGVSLKPYNTLKLQALAQSFVSASSLSELDAALDIARVEGLEVIALGEGSNVVFAGDQSALLLRIQSRGIELLDESDDTVTLRVAAGENWHQFVSWTLRQGYCGLENLALIPGTVGAAPMQNIGAYGVEVGNFIDRVHTRDVATGEGDDVGRTECAFGYRDSIFKGELKDKCVIAAVDFTLPREADPESAYPALRAHLDAMGIARPTQQEVFNAVVEIRRSKLPDPAVEPNAGSFFKNPVVSTARCAELRQRHPGMPHYPQADGSVKLAAAWLIEQCGWKGARRDGVGVHTEHALVLLNCGSDDGRELLSLAADIARDVSATFNIDLRIEPRVYR